MLYSSHLSTILSNKFLLGYDVCNECLNSNVCTHNPKNLYTKLLVMIDKISYLLLWPWKVGGELVTWQVSFWLRFVTSDFRQKIGISNAFGQPGARLCLRARLAARAPTVSCASRRTQYLWGVILGEAPLVIFTSNFASHFQQKHKLPPLY